MVFGEPQGRVTVLRTELSNFLLGLELRRIVVSYPTFFHLRRHMMKYLFGLVLVVMSSQLVGCGPSGGTQQLPPAPLVDEPAAEISTSSANPT